MQRNGARMRKQELNDFWLVSKKIQIDGREQLGRIERDVAPVDAYEVDGREDEVERGSSREVATLRRKIFDKIS